MFPGPVSSWNRYFLIPFEEHIIYLLGPFLNSLSSIDPGVTTDGQTKFINASMCDIRYHAKQYPIIIDMPRVSEEMLLKSCPAEWRPEIDPRAKGHTSDLRYFS